jgi:hypothetical protein
MSDSWYPRKKIGSGARDQVCGKSHQNLNPDLYYEFKFKLDRTGSRAAKNDQQAQSFLFSFGSRSWRSGFQALLECCFQVFRLAILAQ